MMPARVLLANKAPNVRTFTRESAEGFVFAVVETNAKDHRSYEAKILDRLMAAASDGIDAGGTRGEQAFATALAARLSDDESFRKNIGAVFYASVAIDGGDAKKAAIRTAGDIRVHAVDAAGNVRERTRDHNAIDDDAEGVYRESMQDHGDFLRHVPTRAVPTTERKPIEQLDWTLEGIAALVICSSVVHGYREPDAYIKELIGDVAAAVPPFGFAAITTL